VKKLFLFLFLFLFFLINPFFVFADINFYDDFSTPAFRDKWEIAYISPSEDSPIWDSYDWQVTEEGFGIYLKDKQMKTHAVLKNNVFSNFSYSLTLIGRKGEDKNILFRYVDEDNWYGFHISKSGTFFGSRKNGEYSDTKVSNFSLSNNIFYEVKVVIINNRVSLFIDGDEVVSNYKINDNFIESGTIGLKVSTGATYPSEVYFDDIKVTRINPPVVLIPGHGASFNFKEMFLNQPDPDGWQMTPGVRVYDNIIASLEANGYEKGENLFVFNYNWLNSISDTASHLYDFIGNIVDSSSFSGVKIVGHSMGGLVGRACFQEQENECFIDQLITVGSPHRGVLETYGAWEGGEIWRDGLTRLAFEIFLKTQKQPLETNKEALRRLSPSLAEMLPDFAYLKNDQGEEISFNEEDYPKNLFLERIGPVVGDKNNFIFGQEQPTLRWLKVSEDLSWADQFLDNWEHGKPIEKEFSNRGDGTVLALSAYPSENFSGRFFNLGHRETIADPIAVAEIMALLDLEPQGGLEFLTNEENYLVFYLHSPAHLEISNLSEEAGFWEDDLGPKLIIIANPELEKDYLVDVVGDESGRYRLTTGKIYSGDSFWRHYDGFIEPGQTDTFKINLNNFIEVATTGSIHPIEELLEDLKIFSNGFLEEKVVEWQELFDNDYQQALVYGYKLKNWLSLSAKNSILEIDDLLTGLAKIESVISYLEELALAEERPVKDRQLDFILSFWSQKLLEISSLPSQNNSLSRLAALDYLTSNDYYSLLSEDQKNYEKLIYSFSGIGSLVNSQILLQDN